ncbi:hypothetical protein [Actinoplanes sp. NPDC051411]|uniref:hypothetical protein n=1 Tax=Actinoplanes sp. NPDC051411 TaxID=3155522 RepID=UPI00344628D3
MNNLVRAGLLGAATGARSATPLAALASHGGNRWLSALATVAAGGELIADKLPGTPSRVKPAPLAARIVTGAVAAGLDARRRHRGVAGPALVGAAAAAAGSYAGAWWRAFAAHRGFAVPAALAEDGTAILLATLAARG